MEKMTYDELPTMRRNSRNRQFATSTVKDFAGLTCDAAKVTGWPLDNVKVEAKAAALRRAIKEQLLGACVKVSHDRENCYLVRVR